MIRMAYCMIVEPQSSIGKEQMDNWTIPRKYKVTTKSKLYSYKESFSARQLKNKSSKAACKYNGIKIWIIFQTFLLTMAFSLQTFKSPPRTYVETCYSQERGGK